MAKRGIRPERWPELSKLLDQALDLPSEQRTAFLDRAAGADTELRSAADALLAADKKSQNFLGLSAGQVAASLLEAKHGSDGAQLGSYVLGEEIGRGGMGVVYEARDQQLERTVAIKVLNSEYAGDASARARFLREARAASKLDHPHICTVHELVQAEQSLYIVMARYEGETLEERLKRGPVPMDEALRIMEQLAHGLACAHDAGIVHRDIKPANVFITERGEVKILDFGVAKMIDEAALTRTAALPGTLAYMAPEQLQGEPVDARADLWSLGVLFYQMLDGHLPFRSETAGGMVRAILEDTPPTILKRKDELAQAILEGTLAKRPPDRFADARVLLEALDGAYTVRGWPSSVSARRTRRWTPRRMMALIVVLVIAFGLALVWYRSQPPAVALVAFVPFEVEGDLPNLEGLAWSLPWMFGEAIRRRTDIEVIEADEDSERKDVAPAAAVSGTTAIEAAVPTSAIAASASGDHPAAAFLLSGRVRQDGDEVVVDLTVVAPNGRTLGQASERGDLEQRFWSMLNALGTSLFEDLDVELATPFRVEEAVVGTNSAEAWFRYQRAMSRANDGAYDPAIALLAEAVEIDPDFSLAWADLGLLYTNGDELGDARHALDQAVRDADRLPKRQRWAVLAATYAEDWATYGQAREILEETVGSYPDELPPRDNLGAILGWLEDYGAALEQYESLIARETPFLGSYKSAATVAVALGKFSHARELIGQVPVDPMSPEATQVGWTVAWVGGWIANEEADFEAAATHFAEADRWQPGAFLTQYERWRSAFVEADWPRAWMLVDRLAIPATEGAEIWPTHAWWQAFARGQTHLVFGDARQAVLAFRGAEAVGAGRGFTALGKCLAAETLLLHGDARTALGLALEAIDEGRDKWPALQGSFLAALAHQQLGNQGEVERHTRTLRRRVNAGPNHPEERQLHRLEGLLALARGDAEAAVASLREAGKLLPVRGIEFHAYHFPDHIKIWFELGEALLAAGRHGEAQRRFERAVQPDVMRVHAPVAFVRSWYRLGEMATARGDLAAATAYFQSFLAYRSDADLDAEKIEVARAYQNATHEP